MAELSTIADRLDRGQNVLVATPSSEPAETLCRELLETAADPTGLLAITYDRTADEVIEMYCRNGQKSSPERVAVVDIDSANRLVEELPDTEPSGVEMETTLVSHPANLTEIGATVTQLLSEFEAEELQLIGYFDSLTPLVTFTDSKRAHRFLHTFTTHLTTADSISAFYFDPIAHDERTLHRLAGVFDAMVEGSRSDASEYRLRRR